MFTLALMIGISVNDTTIGTTVGNLGMTDVKFPKPVFHGDTIHVTTEVLTLARDASRGPTPASSSSCTRPSTSAASWWRNAAARP